MIHYKSNEEIELMKLSGDLVSKTIAEVAAHIKPGVSLLHLDQIAETFILDHKGTPAFKGYRGFTGTLCTSLNEVVVHGIPDHTILKEGDIISVDCGVVLNQYYGDSAFTFPVGSIPESAQQLLQVTRKSLVKAIAAAKSGNRMGDIGFAVQDYCEGKYGYGVVREMVGHGIGKKLHESPEVPNYGKRGSGPKLLPGLVIAIEPMINLGKRSIAQADDGWTIYATDRKPSAHFEHTVAIRADKTEVLTTFKYIDSVIKLDWLTD
ncbi:methionine aminopeptidase [Bacteroidota bacterium]|nr:methionine aminopeptidase [Bacteroidota bacterium]